MPPSHRVKFNHEDTKETKNIFSFRVFQISCFRGNCYPYFLDSRTQWQVE
jgi:hypothetical protein